MTHSSPPAAGGCSPTPNRDLPGRCVLGRIVGARGFGAGLPPAGRRCLGRCAEPEPAGYGGLRPTHEQSAPGERAGKRAVERRDDGPAEGLGRKRDADRRPRPVASRRTHGPDFVGQAQSAARRHRHRPRPLGPQAALVDDSSCAPQHPIVRLPAVAGSIVSCAFIPKDVPFRPEQPKAHKPPSAIPRG